MDPYVKAGETIGQLIMISLFLVPAILFLLTQQRVLQSVRSENRELKPGLVWLQLIPVFNLYWMFVVVTRIADSISKELVTQQDDSILGIPDYDAVRAIGNRPTYKIGITYCTLYLASSILLFINLFATTQGSDFMIILFALCSLLIGTMICWIVYWVQLTKNKNRLRQWNARPDRAQSMNL